MILKPREFQRVVLVRMGEGGLADDLDAKGSIFRSVPNFDDSVPYDPQLIVEAIVRLLAALVPGRTAVGPHFTLRLHRGPDTKNALPTESRVADSLLDKISAAYNGYRRSSLIKMSQALDVVQSDPRVRELVLGNNLVSMFMKTASAPIASLDSVAYMMGAHLEDRGLLHTTAVDAMVANNKWMADIHAAERS